MIIYIIKFVKEENQFVQRCVSVCVLHEHEQQYISGS